MFTGIIEGAGVVKAIRRGAEDFSIDVDTGDAVENPVIGESVALNGVCLTVVSAKDSILTFDVSAETISRTTLKNVNVDAKLNIERAMRMGDRLGGHMVSGHVDTVGTFTRATPIGDGYEIEVALPSEGMKYIINKGSIAIAGISLTVAAKLERSVTVAVIPHTWEVTSLGTLTVGSQVNIEYDMMAKYIENFIKEAYPSAGSISREFLNKHGY
ncbi:Riboflavin synthase eubacterial/eukaryotic [hydrothermal vent metagenome]|uniref:Riboflavin synthase n=1 Tax=hydrothermal vent metagenome TaxID=652676 RepID=A0A3B1C2G3_9ZZZZ